MQMMMKMRAASQEQRAHKLKMKLFFLAGTDGGAGAELGCAGETDEIATDEAAAPGMHWE